MITIRIDGPEKQRKKLAGRIKNDLMMARNVVRHYVGKPKEILTDCDITIIEGEQDDRNKSIKTN